MAGFFTEDSLQRVKDANDIVSVVESYIPLKKSGTTYKALCPFHREKTPSFTVNPNLQLFKCFGCGEGGDAFRFVMKMDGLSFPEAVEMLASRAGLELEHERGYDAAQAKTDGLGRKALYRINSLGLKYFEQCLAEPQGREALQYLLDRGFTPETVSAWRLGWAPDSYDGFASFLRRECGENAPSAIKAAVTAGLMREGDREPYDFFRGRVMFPIRDTQNRPIAFGGRVLREDPEKKVGKYMNSPETPLFSKSRVMFGLDAAAKEIRLTEKAVVVEGYTDVIMCHQHGIRNVVATLGTALTRDHVRLLRRYAKKVVARFDADAAGSKATDKALRIFIEDDMPLEIVRSLEIKDACEFLPKYGAEAFMTEMTKAEDAFSYHLRRSFENRNLRNVDEKAEAVRMAMEVVNLSPDTVKRQMLRTKVASTAGVPKESLPGPARNRTAARPVNARSGGGGKRTFKQRPQKKQFTAPRDDFSREYDDDNHEPDDLFDTAPVDRKVTRNVPGLARERRLLAYMMKQRDWCDIICSVRPPEEFGTELLRELAADIHDIWTEQEAVDAASVLAKIQDPEASRLLSDIIMSEGPDLREEELAETLHFARIETLEAERDRVRLEMRRATECGNSDEALCFAREVKELSRDLDELRQKEVPDNLGRVNVRETA